MIQNRACRTALGLSRRETVCRLVVEGSLLLSSVTERRSTRLLVGASSWLGITLSSTAGGGEGLLSVAERQRGVIQSQNFFLQFLLFSTSAFGLFKRFLPSTLSVPVTPSTTGLVVHAVLASNAELIRAVHRCFLYCTVDWFWLKFCFYQLRLLIISEI